MITELTSQQLALARRLGLYMFGDSSGSALTLVHGAASLAMRCHTFDVTLDLGPRGFHSLGFTSESNLDSVVCEPRRSQ